MPFDKTKESSSDNTEEDVERDLKEEETSTGDDQPDKEEESQDEDTSTNDEGSEEESTDDDSKDEDSLDYWKERAEKAESDRDNYKQGMLDKKAKKREISKPKEKEADVDINEKKVVAVLEKQNEKRALHDVIQKGSDSYIPEMVDDSQFSEIVGYLPRKLDRSSASNVVRALKLATRMWKEDRGIKDKKAEKKPEIPTKTSNSGTSTGKSKNTSRRILKKGTSMDSWY